jgi:hypothetical protein
MAAAIGVSGLGRSRRIIFDEDRTQAQAAMVSAGAMRVIAMCVDMQTHTHQQYGKHGAAEDGATQAVHEDAEEGAQQTHMLEDDRRSQSLPGGTGLTRAWRG